MNKLVVIGLGGTGLEVIRNLRRNIVKEYDSLDDFKHVGFFYVDTDVSGVAKPQVGENSDTRKNNVSSRWNLLGKDYYLKEKEYLKVELPVISELVEHRASRQNIEHWFPYEQLHSLDTAIKGHPGAGQIRTLGRLAFYQNYTQIRDKFKNLYNSIQETTNGGNTHVYICSSVSGGTGAGMFLDMAYCIQHWLAGENVNTFGFLILPELTAVRGERYFANAYASLMELNYYSLGNNSILKSGRKIPVKYDLLVEQKSLETPPFDNCYIVGMTNDSQAKINLDEAPEMVANRMFLNIDSSFDDAAEGLVQNAQVERLTILEDPITGYLHSQNFFGFGLASIIYPLDKIKDLITYQLCYTTIEKWMSEPPEALDYNNELQSYLQDCRLTDSYIKGFNNIITGQINKVNLKDRLEEILPDVTTQTLVSNEKSYNIVRRTIKEFLDRFLVEGEKPRPYSLDALYSARRNNIHDAVKVIRANLKERIQKDILDRRKGITLLQRLFYISRDYNDQEKAIKSLQGYLEFKFSSYRNETTDDFEALKDLIERIEIACENVEVARNRFIRRDYNTKKALEKVYPLIEQYLELEVDLKVNEYAKELLAVVIDEIKKISRQVNGFINELTELLERFKKEANVILQYLDNTDKHWRGNVFILFQQNKVEEIFQQIKKRGIPNDLEQKLSEYELIEVFRPKNKKVDFKIDLSEHLLYREAVSFIENTDVQHLFDTNIVDKFYDIYKEPAERREIIDSAFRRGDFYFSIDKNERIKGKGTSKYQGDANSKKRIVALSGSNEEISSLKSFKVELENAGVDLASDLKIISNPYQIVFLTETAAFPLRIGQEVGVLKGRYGEYMDNSDIPLHLSKNYNPALYDLFLSDEEDKLMRRQEFFYICRAMEWMELKEDNIDSVKKVYYEYREKGVSKHIFLRKDWQDSLDLFSGNYDREIRRTPDYLKGLNEAREKVETQIDHLLRQLDTVEKRKCLVIRLNLTLEDIRKESNLDNQDPLYIKCTDIVGRILKERYYHLESVDISDSEWEKIYTKYYNTGKKPPCPPEKPETPIYTPEPGDIVTCPNCSSKLPANAKFCSECGTKVVEVKTCPNCEAKLDNNAKFCVECGSKIN